MNNFEGHLLRIYNAIEIDPNDDYIFKTDFEIVRDYVFNIMCNQDSNFSAIFQGGLLFGSYASNVRIHFPSEFDVLMKLEFPFYTQIEEQDDYERPGYINLDFTDVCSHMEFFDMENNHYHYNYDEVLKDFINENLTCNEMQYLERTRLKSWLHEVFKGALRASGNTVRGKNGDLYTLSYAWRGITYTITAKTSVRNFSIDFVPAVKYVSATSGFGWYAIPKAVTGPKETANYTFQICNPSAEKNILDYGGNMNVKIVLRLLQSLRNEKQLPELRCYFLITACLWELKHNTKQFWLNSIDFLLVHMINVLCSYFRKGFLPFYWDTGLNLLVNFSENDLMHYEHVLNATYNTLSTYVIDAMTPFALQLREIDNAISIRPGEYESYFNDFNVIRNYIIKALAAVDGAFAYLFGGPTLTGSIPLNVRIHVPNEFDVLLNIALPHSNLLSVQYMQECPGFLQIDLKHIMRQLYHTASAPYFVYTHLQKLIDPSNFLLCRKKLQQWIHYTFQLALQAAGNRVICSDCSYILTYKQHGISHTIYAKCQNTDSLIKIDFVPAVTFVDWKMPNRILFATPRGAFRSTLYIRDHSFFLCNATAEIEHFINAPANVRAVARLLKCSYNRKQMPRFKSYFITTALLWEMHQPISFWQQPLDILFLYMIEKLIWYMKTCYLPFFWERRFNFLCYLTKDDCKNYQKQLRDGAKMLLNAQSKPKPFIIDNDSLNNLSTKMMKLRLNKSANVN